MSLREIRIQVEVNPKLCLLLLRLAKVTMRLWFPWRKTVISWLRCNAIHLCRVRVANGRWQWL